jgi:hypothetical protein
LRWGQPERKPCSSILPKWYYVHVPHKTTRVSYCGGPSSIPEQSGACILFSPASHYSTDVPHWLPLMSSAGLIIQLVSSSIWNFKCQN